MNIIEENPKKKQEARPNKRLKLNNGNQKIVRKAKTLNKKNLEEFDKANTRECLSDDGEEAASKLFEVILRAQNQAKYPHKKLNMLKS